MNASRQFVHDLMHDRKNDFLSKLAGLPLLVLSYLYGFLVGCNHFFYNINLLKSYSVPAFVISVGNITLGGTGKTPFSIMLCRYLRKKTQKTAILIRGYGEDEWKMLEDKLGEIGAQVFVGRDRVKNAREAAGLGVGAIVLDDGFQHRRLGRDLDIVLVDSVNPFGNGRLFPRGILREAPLNLKRADIVVLTKADKGKDILKGTEEKIKKIIPGAAIIKAFHRPVKLIEFLKGRAEGLSFIRGKKVLLVSAICDPGYFRYTVEKTGASVTAEFIFPDHYTYAEDDLERIFKESRDKNTSIIVTTEKDAVKLKNFTVPDDFRILALAVELEIIEGEEILDAQLHRLSMCRSRKAG